MSTQDAKYTTDAESNDTTTKADDEADADRTPVSERSVDDLAGNEELLKQFAYANRSGVTSDRLEAFKNVLRDQGYAVEDTTDKELLQLLHKGTGFVLGRLEHLEVEYERHLQLARVYNELRRSKNDEADEVYRDIHALADNAGVEPDV